MKQHDFYSWEFKREQNKSTKEVEELSYKAVSLDGLNWSLLSTGGVGRGTYNNPFEEHVWSRAIASYFSKMISGVPYKIYRDINRDLVPDEEITDQYNPWIRLFKRPNLFDTWRSMIKSLVVQLALDGNAYIIARDSAFNAVESFGMKNPPGSIEVALNNNITVHKNNSNGYPAYWDYNRGLKSERLRIDNVCWIFETNTKNKYEGSSAIRSVKRLIESDANAEQCNVTFFKKGGKVEYAITMPADVDEEKARRMSSSLSEQIRGSMNYGNIPIIGGGADIKKFGSERKDFDFENMFKLNREAYMAVMGIPKTKLSITDKVDRATAAVFEKQVWTDTLLPMMVDIEDRINHSILYGAGIVFAFDISHIDALQDTRNISMNNASKAFAMGVSLNTVLRTERLGYPTIEEKWADESIDVRKINQVDEREQSVERSVNDVVNSKIFIEKQDREEGEFEKLSDEDYLKEYHRLVINVKNTSEYKAKLVNFWNKLQNDQLKRIDEMGKSFGVTKEIGKNEYVFDEDEWSDKLADLSIPYVERAMELVHRFDRRDGIFSEPFDVDADVVAQVMRRKLTYSKRIVSRFHDNMKDVVAIAIEDKTPTKELAKQISDQFSIKRKEALDTAITEMNQSSAAYRWEAMKKINGKKKWISAGDSEVRSSHNKYAGLSPKPISFEYNSGLKYPNDMGASAEELINCRCSIRIVRS